MNTTASPSLKYTLVPRHSLRPRQVNRMYGLMTESYDSVERERFLDDLAAKQFVGLLLDTTGAVQGFSTFAMNPGGGGGSTYNIVFSGDTIISPEYWGTQELVRGWCTTVGSLLAREPRKKLYWLLISKGHRTYMYLPLFFSQYYPALEESRGPTRLRELADRCARTAFGRYWSPQEGILRFPRSRGQLKPELAAGTRSRSRNRHVDFYLSRNPRFDRGDELVCLAEITPDNMRGLARKYVLKGMQSPLPWDAVASAVGCGSS